MTKIARSKKVDPLAAPIADQAQAMPASDRLVDSSDNLPRVSADAVAEFRDQIGQKQAGKGTLLERIDALVDAAPRAIASDEDSAGRCAELQRQIAAATKVVEDTRKTVKEPYLEAGRAVDREAESHKMKLNGAAQTVRTRLQAYLVAEERKRQAELERQREEQARRLREEEEARKAAEEKGEEPPPPPAPEPEPIREAPKTTVRGDYGASAGLTKSHKGEITDWKKAFNAVKDDTKVREAIQAAINAIVRKAPTKAIPGVNIVEDYGVRVR
jgi:hypothetical protein